MTHDNCESCKHREWHPEWEDEWGYCRLIMSGDSDMIRIGSDDDYNLSCETQPDFVCGLYEPMEPKK